jgi:glutaconate CoA-transferase subunit B
VSKELVVTSMHEGVTQEQIVEATGWPIHFAPELERTQPPTARELTALRDLQERTVRAHGGSGEAARE